MVAVSGLFIAGLTLTLEFDPFRVIHYAFATQCETHGTGQARIAAKKRECLANGTAIPRVVRPSA
jgi:hypothetical protein